MALDVDKLKEKIEDKYGDLDDEMGCYINHNWLSVKDVVDLIDDCGDDADALKDRLEETYGDLHDDTGCSVGDMNEWLSVKSVVNLIDDCTDED
jgi:hypothetical protein